MLYPSVVIVGRPNVGKSTLFNALVGSRVSIEAPTSGVTRDRVLYPLTIDDRTFDLIDTGGIGVVDRQQLEAQVERQIALAIEAATLVVFLVDARDGVTPLDEEVASRLRKANKPVLLAANKADTRTVEDALPSFHALGFGDALALSAKHRRNLGDLEDAIVARLPEESGQEAPELEQMLKLAFVGRRNVGKSSLINYLAGEERVIVSDLPGTTRDSVDVIVRRDDFSFVAIDTAGMRKRGQMDDVMEFFGHVRTERSIRRADVVFLMLDATDEISKVDKRLGRLIVEECKPCIVALNKWDLACEKRPDLTVESYREYLAEKLPGLNFCPLCGISAKSGENVWGALNKARVLAEQNSRQTGTGKLNQAIQAAQAQRRPKPQHGKMGKIYYGTQVGVNPPTFVMFCNNPATFDDNYHRYLAGQLRQRLNYPEIPLRLFFRPASKKEIGRYGGH